MFERVENQSHRFSDPSLNSSHIDTASKKKIDSAWAKSEMKSVIMKNLKTED